MRHHAPAPCHAHKRFTASASSRSASDTARTDLLRRAVCSSTGCHVFRLHAAEGLTTAYQQCYRRVGYLWSCIQHPRRCNISRSAGTSLLHCPGRSVAVLANCGHSGRESATSFSNASCIRRATVDAAAPGWRQTSAADSSSAICHWLSPGWRRRQCVRFVAI